MRNIYLMVTYTKIEKDILNIQLGCVLRLARLEQGISQFQLGLTFGTSETMIGRIERAENFTSWDKIFVYSEYFNLDIRNLLKLKSEVELLAIVDKSLKLEDKLTKAKIMYYENLKKNIIEKYSMLASQ